MKVNAEAAMKCFRLLFINNKIQSSVSKKLKSIFY